MEKVIAINNINDCKKNLSNLENYSYTINITIQNDDYDCLQYLIKHSQKIKTKVTAINLNLPYEMIPKKDFSYIFNLCAEFPNASCNVYVNHRYIDDDKFIDKIGTVMWSLQTIIRANKSINDVCDFIKNNNFSPFEAYAYIHNYVSTIAKYNISPNGGTWLSHDQFFPGAFLDLPEVVCMGYSSLEKEIIDTLNMPGLKCDIVSVSFYNKDNCKTDKHARCIVRVFDDKYEINQSYYDDPTWDNVIPTTKKTPIFTHFAMNNNCHNRQVNDKYEYSAPSLVKLSPKHVKNIEDLTSSWEYNKNKKTISQQQIELAYFIVLVKTKPNLSFDDLYSTLSQMVKQSYAEQSLRRFKGNLTQESPILTKQIATTIYKQIKSDAKNNNSKQPCIIR